MLVPKKDAFVISRTRPIILEAKVIKERIRPDFTRDFFSLPIDKKNIAEID
jgi:hypothetical protein